MLNLSKSFEHRPSVQKQTNTTPFAPVIELWQHKYPEEGSHVRKGPQIRSRILSLCCHCHRSTIPCRLWPFPLPVTLWPFPLPVTLLPGHRSKPEGEGRKFSLTTSTWKFRDENPAGHSLWALGWMTVDLMELLLWTKNLNVLSFSKILFPQQWKLLLQKIIEKHIHCKISKTTPVCLLSFLTLPVPRLLQSLI